MTYTAIAKECGVSEQFVSAQAKKMRGRGEL